MWNDETEGLRNRISRLSNEELLQMVNLDYEQYREEALDYARAEMERRGLKIEPVTFTDAVEAGAEAADAEHGEEVADSEYFTSPTENGQEAGDVSRVEFKVFSDMWASWDELFSEAAAFATEIGPLNLIGISHASTNEKIVTVWYWA